VSVSNITPVSSYGSGTTYLTPLSTSYQSTKISQNSTPKAYTVELSHATQVRSLRLQGFSSSMIALKTGLDINTVNTYLDITGSAANVTPPPTYVPPKAAYSEPQTISESRTQLRQDLDKLTMVTSTWSSLMPKQSTSVSSLTHKEAPVTLLTLKPAFDEFSLLRRQ
jgi:hypothetical protein